MPKEAILKAEAKLKGPKGKKRKEVESTDLAAVFWWLRRKKNYIQRI